MINRHFYQPIGVFDSGIGGLTVANAILKHLPNEELIYFGDTAHMPYGEKSADAIRYYCLRIVKFLLEKNCKIIVIACNSAASAAYKILLDFFGKEVLFVNVVDPLVERVCQTVTANGVRQEGYRKVGVIATKATIKTGVYEQKLKELQPNLEVISLATPLLAPMIEEGFFHDKISHSVIENYLSYPDFEGIEAMLLACTHYPLIKMDIEAFFDNKVKIYDSTDVVAEEVRRKLAEHNLLNDKKRHEHHFYVSDYTESFERSTKVFFPSEIKLERMAIWTEGM